MLVVCWLTSKVLCGSKWMNLKLLCVGPKCAWMKKQPQRLVSRRAAASASLAIEVGRCDQENVMNCAGVDVEGGGYDGGARKRRKERLQSREMAALSLLSFFFFFLTRSRLQRTRIAVGVPPRCTGLKLSGLRADASALQSLWVGKVHQGSLMRIRQIRAKCTLARSAVAYDVERGNAGCAWVDWAIDRRRRRGDARMRSKHNNPGWRLQVK